MSEQQVEIGEKQAALNAYIEKRKKSDPDVHHVVALRNMLARPYFLEGTDPDDLMARVFPDDSLPMAEHLLKIEEVRELIGKLKSAADEAYEDAKMHLHHIMGTKGPTLFAHMGKRFSMSSTAYVQARKELGGTGNPDLKDWLLREGMPDIAAGTINAATFKSGVNKWIAAHPIEATDGDRDLHGEELLEALGLVDVIVPETYNEDGDIDVPEHVLTAAEQLTRRISAHAQLNELARIEKVPTLSMTAV